MDKAFALELIKLLSALESWSFSTDRAIPDYLHESISGAVKRLSDEVLG
jgi:hypothetical protein